MIRLIGKNNQGACVDLHAGENTMPIHPNSLAPMVLITSLAAAMMFSSSLAVFAAGACIEKPNQQDQFGHWYYRTDRETHRKCWFFEASGAKMDQASSLESFLSQKADLEPDWVSWLATRLKGTTPPATRQAGNNNSAGVTQAVSPEVPKIESVVPVAQSRGARRSRTSVAGTLNSRQQPLSQSHADKDQGGNTPQLSPEQRDVLFREFLLWREAEKHIPL